MSFFEELKRRSVVRVGIAYAVSAWVTVAVADGDKSFEAYPDESLAEWHLRLGLEDGGN